MANFPISVELNPIGDSKLADASLRGNVKHLLKKMTLKQQQESHQTVNEFKLFGLNGEVITVLDNGRRLEVWDWTPHSSANTLTGALHLVAGITFPIDVSNVWPLSCSRRDNYYQLIVRGESNVLYFADNENTWMELPLKAPITDLTISGNSQWFVLADNTTGLLLIHETNTLKLVTTLQTKVRNSKAVFDIKGHWICILGEKAHLTKIVLNQNGKLLNKLLTSLGKKTLDSIQVISQVSQNKINHFYNPDTPAVSDTSSYSELISTWFNSFSNTSDYPTILDVSLEKPHLITQFQVRDSCSAVSLSPNDLHLITVSKRGDDISLWDFSKFHTQITLGDKWSRGATIGAIDMIKWGNSGEVFIKSFGSNSIRSLDTTTGEINWKISNTKFKDFAPVRSEFDACITVNEDIITLDGVQVKSYLTLPKVTTTYPEPSNIKLPPLLVDDDHIEIESCKPFIPLYSLDNVTFKEIDCNFSNWTNYSSIPPQVYQLRTPKLNIPQLKSQNSSIDGEISICMATNL